MLKFLPALFALTLPSLAVSGVLDKELLGFKIIHFNSTKTELEGIGLSCPTSDFTFPCSATVRLEGLTFLNQEVLVEGTNKLWVFLSDSYPHNPDEIHVYVNLPGSTVARSLRASLGSPTIWNDWEYWFFRNGASISTYNPPNGFWPAKTLYRSPNYTKQTLRKILPSELQPTLNANDW